MEAKTLLVALVLLLSQVALGGAAERCAQPGALRCEEGRHQSVCLERSRVWHRVSDCAAAGGFCADGRCVTGVDGRDARETCNYPTDTMKCAENCTAIDICLTTNAWTSIQCGGDQLCDESSISCKPAKEAKCKEKIECPLGLNIFLPDLTNSSRYYDCTEGGEGLNHACDNGWFFNACSGRCDYDVDPSHRYPNKCTNMNPGYSNHIFSFPGLYYVCLNAQEYWMLCYKGYFDSMYGKCVGQSDYTQTCSHTGD